MCVKIQCINLPAPEILWDAVTPNTFIFVVSLITQGHFFVFLAQTPELFVTGIEVPPLITTNAFQVEFTPCYNSFFFLSLSLSLSSVKHSVQWHRISFP